MAYLLFVAGRNPFQVCFLFALAMSAENLSLRASDA